MPTNIYSPWFFASQSSGALRSGAMQDMGKTGQFLYQVGTSALDSAVNMAVSTGLVGAVGGLSGAAAQNAIAKTMNFVMGSEVAADSVYRGIQEGKSNSTALIDGIVEGAIEGFTEEHSVGDILDGMLNGGTIWQKLRNAAISEGSEEVASNWLNRAYDVISKQDKSEVLKAYNGYVDTGKSPAQALAAVVGDFVGEDTVSFLAGGLSGLAMSGAYAGANKVTERFVDPTASAWDQAMLDTMQGIQTPENVTQTRQATATDNAILQTFNQNKNTSAKVSQNNTSTAEMPGNVQNNNTSAYVNENVTQAEAIEAAGKAGRQAESAATVQKLRDSIPALSEIAPTASVSTQEVQNTTGRTMAEKAKALFERIAGVVKRPGFGDIEINKRAVKDDLSHGVGVAKAAVIPAIPSVLQNGTQIDYQENWKNRGYDTYVFAAPITMDGQNVYVEAIVRRTSKNTLYLHEVVDSNGNIIKIDDGARANPTSLVTDSDAGTQTPSNQNVTSPAAAVNTQNTPIQRFVRSDGTTANVSEVLEEAGSRYGTIPAGENPVREVSLPQSVDGERKVSRFARTAAEAQVTTDEMVSRIEQMVADGGLNYEVYSNKQALNDGARYIRKQYERGKSIEQIRSEFIRDAERGFSGAERVATGTTLYADAVADGNYQAAADILLAIQHMQTNSGQTIQAARLMKSMTPEGRVFIVQGLTSDIISIHAPHAGSDMVR